MSFSCEGVSVRSTYKTRGALKRVPYIVSRFKSEMTLLEKISLDNEEAA